MPRPNDGTPIDSLTSLKRSWNDLLAKTVSPYSRTRKRRLDGRLANASFVRPNGETAEYAIYLPEGYESGNDEYPVLYHLHGAHVTRRSLSLDINHLGAQLERAIKQGTATPALIVGLANPRMDMWADSHDGGSTPTTLILDELIPHVEATYRTRVDVEGRLMSGYSMGGFGVAHIAGRSPGRFGALVLWDAAIHTWNTFSSLRSEVAEEVFNNEDYFDQYSPDRLVGLGDAAPRMMLLVGRLTQFNRPFKKKLDAGNVDTVYVETACGHDFFCMIREAGLDAFSFLLGSGSVSSSGDDR